MRTLSARELLEVWDRGADRPPYERALALLAFACPEIPEEDLAALPIGRRDGLLLDLRARTFGPDLVSVAACPGCGERLETAFRVEEIRAEPASPTPPTEPAGPFVLTAEGWTVRFRLPDSRDLAAVTAVAVAGAGGAEGDGGALLFGRCVLSAEDAAGRPSPTGAQALPAAVVRALTERMEQLDPQADVRIALACPACGRRFESSFDILDFFWSEIAVWAERTLSEIHLLAAAYGWREPDILALSPRRRQAYLQRVAG